MVELPIVINPVEMKTHTPSMAYNIVTSLSLGNIYEITGAHTVGAFSYNVLPVGNERII